MKDVPKHGQTREYAGCQRVLGQGWDSNPRLRVMKPGEQPLLYLAFDSCCLVLPRFKQVRASGFQVQQAGIRDAPLLAEFGDCLPRYLEELRRGDVAPKGLDNFVHVDR